MSWRNMGLWLYTFYLLVVGISCEIPFIARYHQMRAPKRKGDVHANGTSD